MALFEFRLQTSSMDICERNAIDGIWSKLMMQAKVLRICFDVYTPNFVSITLKMLSNFVVLSVFQQNLLVNQKMREIQKCAIHRKQYKMGKKYSRTAIIDINKR